MADRPSDTPSGAPDPASDLVCFCMRVTEGELRAAIKAGARTLDDLIETTYAATGCGTCRFDLQELLREADEADGIDRSGEGAGGR